MDILQAIILGIVQGVTELLPISSSAHLYIIPWLFGWAEQEAFDVALHFGTLLAIVLFFYKDWIKLISGGYKLVVKKQKSFEGRMFWYLVAATIPGGIIGLVLDKFAGDVLKQPLIIATALFVMGILLFIPGVSRSGVTMTTGRLMGIDRESTAKYTFLLATPIVFAATLFKIKDFVFNLPFIIGVLVSFIVGAFVIKFLLNYLKKGSFKIFAIYRVLFAILIVIVYFIRL